MTASVNSSVPAFPPTSRVVFSHLRKALGDNPEDTRLIVTIARKGYQFTARVAVAEAADTAVQAAVQVSTAESSLADTQPALQSPADEAVPKAPRLWRKAAFVVRLPSFWWSCVLRPGGTLGE
jgi:hypothetical protein